MTRTTICADGAPVETVCAKFAALASRAQPINIALQSITRLVASVTLFRPAPRILLLWSILAASPYLSGSHVRAAHLAYDARGTEVLAPDGLHRGDVFNLVFATSGTFRVIGSTQNPPIPGRFGSLTAADYSVTQAASDAGLLATWNGVDIVWHAILSDHTTSAADRLAPYTQGPIYNMNRQLVAASATALWSGSIEHPINFDENGALTNGGRRAWTGTNTDGTSSGLDAGNWLVSAGTTGTYGSPFATNGGWVNGGSTNGNAALSLYGISLPFVVIPEPSSLTLLGVGTFCAVASARRRKQRA